MPEIRPMRDLRDTNAISRLCHSVSEPVFITKNGYQDLVIMSNEEYERRCAASSKLFDGSPQFPT